MIIRKSSNIYIKYNFLEASNHFVDTTFKIDL